MGFSKKHSVGESLNLTKVGGANWRPQAEYIHSIIPNGGASIVYYWKQGRLYGQNVTQSAATVAGQAVSVIQITPVGGTAYYIAVNQIEPDGIISDGATGSYIQWNDGLKTVNLHVTESLSALATLINAASPGGNEMTTNTNQSASGIKTWSAEQIFDAGLSADYVKATTDPLLFQDDTGADQLEVAASGVTALQSLFNLGNIGSVPSAAIAAREFGDGRNHVTELTITGLDLGAIGAAGNLALGTLIYTLPSGVQSYEVTSILGALTGDVLIQADTPELGVGSVIASGAVAVLGGTATFEDYVVGTAVADCNGSVNEINAFPTSGSTILNGTTDVKDLFLNSAFNWTDASASLLFDGVITLKWTTMMV